MASKFIPYGRQVIEDEDIAAVTKVLRSDWLTTGPLVVEFEQTFAKYVGAQHAIAASNGTAALHLTTLAAGIGPGDEVIVPALTFVASANCARYVGAKVVFADIRPDTLTIDVDHVEKLITPRTRAIVAVDYAGLPADLGRLVALARKHNLVLIEDACHAPGAEFERRSVGTIADMTVFSFHPVKHLTTGEGGMISTNDPKLAASLRKLRNHGIETDHRQREHLGTWQYDMVELGFNYRLNDIQCALGLSQLQRLPETLARRRVLAAQYDQLLSNDSRVVLQSQPEDRKHAWHLYTVRIAGSNPSDARKRAFGELRKRGIGVNVHYLPVYLHSYYRGLGYEPGLCPHAEHAYNGLLSMPMWHGLSDADQLHVVEQLRAVLSELQ